MLLEGRFLEFHRYVSSHNLPLEAIGDAYGARHRAGGQIVRVVRADVSPGVRGAACACAAVGDGDGRGHARMKDAEGGERRHTCPCRCGGGLCADDKLRLILGQCIHVLIHLLDALVDARIAGQIYVPTDFDTIEKAFSGVKTAEKGIKQGLSRSNADFGSPCYVCSIGVQMPRIIVDAYSPVMNEEAIHPTAKKVNQPTNDLPPS